MLTPVKAIRAKCLDCCCGQSNEVKMCTVENCALYPYRLGKNPNYSKVELSDEERERRALNIRKVIENSSKNKKLNVSEGNLKGENNLSETAVISI